MDNLNIEEEVKDFAKSVLYNSWTEFVEKDLKEEPDPDLLEPILKATGLSENNPIVKLYRVFSGGFEKGIEFIRMLDESVKGKTAESIYRQHFFIEMLCKSSADNKPMQKSELIAFYSERINVFIPENCDNIKEIAENDIANLENQGFFDVKTIENSSFYTVNAKIHQRIMEEFKAAAIQELEEKPNDLDEFFKIHI